VPPFASVPARSRLRPSGFGGQARSFPSVPVVLVVLLALASTGPIAQTRRPLSSADIDDIATLVKLEDTRQFDDAALGRILKSAHPEVRRRAVVAVGRIVNERGRILLLGLRDDADTEVRASVAFAAGQLKDPAAVVWLGELLDNPGTPPAVAREAAQALGKIRTPQARTALARYLNKARSTAATDVVIGEALLSLGRFTDKGDLGPIVRWASAVSVEVRWRAAWALFRPRDPAAVPHLLKMADDGSPDVRFWAVRGLAPALVDQAGLSRATVSARLVAATRDADRRVRTEALRVLVQYDDDGAFEALVAGLASPDTWISTSAAEAASRFASRAAVLTPKLIAAAAPDKPLWLRQTALTPLVTLAPEAAIEVATSLARWNVAVARTSAVQALGRLGAPGRARLDELNADPALTGLLPAAGGRGAGGGGGTARPPAPARTDADYRRIVEKWIVPDYNGQPKPQAIWETPRGTIELELYPGDAPMGVEYFMQSVASGDIVGTEFGRVVPNFVAQQQAIRNAPTLRDEVNRHGLTRANLAWASAGLDTGRPGYTLGNTPQPHNEGDFTALGRVVRGMDAVDRLEWGDKITAATIKSSR
jgi:HEAT repeat protein/cyclophilin family peptidyl-prolyl cis-trans isomerase